MAQQSIITGMTGLQVRNALNANDTELYGNVATLMAFKNSIFIDGYNVLAFGAKGDGVTDDTVAITNALNQVISSNSSLIFPEGTYLISSNLSFDISRKKIKIVGSGKTVIKTTNNVITIKGINGADDTLTQNIAKGDDHMHATSLHMTVQVNDLILIASTENYANVGISNHKKGEIVEVSKIADGIIYFKSKTYDSYIIANTTIKNMNAGCLTMASIRFENTTLHYENLNRSSFFDLDVVNQNIAGIEIYFSKNIICDFLRIERAGVDYVGNPYGICPAGVQNFTIRSCYLANWKQAIIAGGEYPTRDYFVLYNRTENEGTTAGMAVIDTHTNCENIQIVGNTMRNGGIYAKGKNITVKDNECYKVEIYREDLTDDLNHELHLTDYLNIIDNKCNSIWFGFASYRDIVPIINIKGNVVKATNQYALLIYRDFDTDCVIKNLNIEGNYLESNSNDSVHYAVLLTGGMSIKNFRFRNNIVKSTDFHPFFSSNGPVIENTFIEGNEIKTSGVNKRVYIYNILKAVVNGNNFNDCILYTANVHLKVMNNTWIGITEVNAIIKMPADALNSYEGANNYFFN